MVTTVGIAPTNAEADLPLLLIAEVTYWQPGPKTQDMQLSSTAAGAEGILQLDSAQATAAQARSQRARALLPEAASPRDTA